MKKRILFYRKRPLIRLRGYDYSKDGYYHVTIRTFEGRPFFGHIQKGIMCLNEIGNMAYRYWFEIPNHFPNVQLDEFNILPNHIHGVLIFERTEKGTPVSAREGRAQVSPRDLAADTRNAARNTANDTTRADPATPSTFGPLRKNTLGTVVHAFKSTLKRWCNQNDYPDFQWMPRFYDHIIRSDESFQRIRNYVHHNTLKHSSD